MLDGRLFGEDRRRGTAVSWSDRRNEISASIPARPAIGTERLGALRSEHGVRNWNS